MPIDEGQHNDTKRFLQLCMLIELIQHNIRIGIGAQFDDNAHTLAVRFIPQCRNAIDFFIPGQIGNGFNDPCLIDLIRDFRNDDTMLTFIHRFDFCTGAHLYAAPARRIGFDDAISAHDFSTCREIRSLYFCHQFFQTGFRVIDEHDTAVDDFAQVMGRDVRRHADSNASRTIDQQIRDLGRQDRRFLKRTIIVRHEIDGILVDIFQHFTCNFSHADFCITHSCRRVAIDRTEVAMTIYQWIPGRKILGQADGCIVYRTITMGMIFT